MNNISFATNTWFTCASGISYMTGTFSPGNGEFKLPPNQEYGRPIQLDETKDQLNALGFAALPQNQEYFTPSIEDIRVGYECEILWNYNYLPEDEWCKVRTFEGSTEDFDIIDFEGRIANSKLRVPYLTKEQIEAEGWEITAREVKAPPYEVDWINAKKGEHTLWINLAMHKSMHMGISDKIYNVYRGQCKDINTFRYICKLLGI